MKQPMKNPRKTPVTAAKAACIPLLILGSMSAGRLHAQTTLLNETFDTGVTLTDWFWDGGSFENRVRLPTEILTRIRAAVSPDHRGQAVRHRRPG